MLNRRTHFLNSASSILFLSAIIVPNAELPPMPISTLEHKTGNNLFTQKSRGSLSIIPATSNKPGLSETTSSTGTGSQGFICSDLMSRKIISRS